MKRRYADRRNTNDIIDKELIIKRVKEDYFDGYISYLKVIKVKKKWLVDVENRCILDNNYIWFNIYPLNKNYCINAIIDDNNEIVQWYFDISKNIGVEDGIPYEDDLYLDVVIVNNGKINILDEDELDNAFKVGDITYNDYNLAHKVKEELLNTYGKDINKLRKITNDLIKKIKE